MNQFDDKVAVVTGAASGIGFATASKFAAAGMRVVLADIEQVALETAVKVINDSGHTACGVVTDVSDWAQIQQLAEATMDTYGAVHVVHNNAGVVVAGTIEELSIKDWEWVLGVDLWSVIYGVKAFLPLIKQSGEGHIINTASTAGIASALNIGPYNVAKFGVVAMTETLKLQLKAEKSAIGASVLCPGAVNTRITESHRNRQPGSGEQPETETEIKFREGAGALLAKGKDPDDVAEMVMHAIINQEFWIITHPEWKKVMQKRVQGMVESNQLVTGFGG
ncbi:MAG: SDR family NAD(P)-dependent oxidoreductase [bacterium]|nr:SDR family NAD(P)-dependent oxidoreductase [Gammaproteobacteria bacterium]HIL97810.1 SDR family NAD(P)-dependent oxidoreductase [Pseudomonadales bacterium]